MAGMTKKQIDESDKAALGFWGGHGRNFLKMMTGNKEPLEKVPSWGEARSAAMQTAAGQQPAAPSEPAMSGAAIAAEQPGAPGTPPVLTNQSKVAPSGQPSSVAPAPPAKPFQTTLANGINYSGDPQDGSRVFTMGTKGQDGYGYIKAHGTHGQGQAPVGFHGSQQLAGATPGYSFEGSAEDAAKFSAPVARPAPTPATLGMQGGDYRQVRAEHEAGKMAAGGENPEYVGPEGGWGWKGRGEIYKARLADRLSRDNNALQEGGADRRALLQARGANDRNMLDAARLGIDRQRLAGEQGAQALDMQSKQLEIGFNKQKSALIDKLNTTTDPTQRRALYSQLLAMQGKDPAQKYQVVTNEGIDPVTNIPVKKSYAVNQDDPSQSFVIGGGNEADSPEIREINSNPGYLKAYTSADPNKKREMLDTLRKRMAEEAR